MLTFKLVRWKNFLSTGNTFTEVKLDQPGTTLIIGDNGSGKSTIVDAIAFALYGKPYRAINKPQLVNSINNKNLEVEIIFETQGHQYNVIRGIKPNKFEIYLDGQLVDQTAFNKDYQEFFESSVLQMNYQSFIQNEVLGTASFCPFMQLPAAKRREVIEDILDIQIFSKMNEKLKVHADVNRDTIKDLITQSKMIHEFINIHKSYEQNPTINVDTAAIVEEKKQAIEGLKQQEKQKQKQINQYADINDKIDQNQQKIDQINDALRQVNEKKLKLITKSQQYADDIGLFNDKQCSVCEQEIDEQHRQKLCDKYSKQILKLTDQVDYLDEQIEKANSKLLKLKEIRSSLTNDLRASNSLVTEIAVIQSSIKQSEKSLQDIVASTKHSADKINETGQKTIELHKQQLEDNKDQLEILQKDKNLLDYAQSLLKDTGIKTLIIKQYVPIINKLINKYLASMDFFVNFELDHNFNETIKSRHRDTFSYNNFSEGQKMRIDLALLFTWRSIVKMRRSCSTNLLILDEVFDSSLDSKGTDDLMKILNTVDKQTSIFVISHKGDQLHDKFDRIIKFEYSKNYSRIV